MSKKPMIPQDLHRQIYRQTSNINVTLKSGFRQILPAEMWKCLLETILLSFDPEVCTPVKSLYSLLGQLPDSDLLCLPTCPHTLESAKFEHLCDMKYFTGSRYWGADTGLLGSLVMVLITQAAAFGPCCRVFDDWFGQPNKSELQ